MRATAMSDCPPAPHVAISLPRFERMFPIVEAEFLAPDVKRFVIEAPRVAKKGKAGQFVIIRLHAHGERIPLTIADSDPERERSHSSFKESAKRPSC